MRLLIGLLAVLAPLTVVYADEADDTIYLFSIPVDFAEGQSAPLGDRVIAAIRSNDPEATRRSLDAYDGIQVDRVEGEQVHVTMSRYPTQRGVPQAMHSEASFVVDFDEAPVGDIVTEITELHGQRPSVGELEAFVFQLIDDKTYARSFDLASRVARTGEGDCTEHAVLLAAFSRSFGYPARVVLGVMVVEGDGRAAGFGHAWTEIHVDGRWQIADATRPAHEDGVLGVRYIPVSSLGNEGPGYGMELLNFAAAQPSAIRELGTAPD